MSKVRLDIETIAAYFGFSGAEADIDDEDEEQDGLKELDCTIIKTHTGLTFYVSNAVEEIDEMIKHFNSESRMGFMGDSHND